MQTANDFEALPREAENLLEFDFFFSDAVRFIPVEFRSNNRTIPKTHDRRAFHLAPETMSIAPVQPPRDAKLATRRNHLDILNIGENLKQRRYELQICSSSS